MARNSISYCYTSITSRHNEKIPTAKELESDFKNYWNNIESEDEESELYKQIEELINPVNNNNTNSSSYEINPSAIYTSRGFNFKSLPKPKNLNENNDKNTNELTTEDYQVTDEFSMEIL
ncbi:hypothetical protein Glove_79g128 [Diversispora epigaea]|uniref:Uncharacterized protein n=1 Tax=Diversispora epigaea TaxID=1348612 RepID=A0A397JF49_9GLOM|nr:hypothetical protein Glove_79g128 [Diversispora epigaea]